MGIDAPRFNTPTVVPIASYAAYEVPLLRESVFEAHGTAVVAINRRLMQR